MSKADEIIQKMKYEVSEGEYSTIKTKDLEEILNYIDNSISKEVIKEKIEELEKSQFKVKNNKLIYSREDVFRFQIYILEELLEGKYYDSSRSINNTKRIYSK